MTETGECLSVSVVVCCFNSEQRLPIVLRHLLRQRLDKAISWEVIIVDNASSDATAQIPHIVWPPNPPAPLRVVKESRRGLSGARRRGYEVARGSLISFIDDDNWVCEDWVQRVHDIFVAHPKVGACGGFSVAIFEGTEPSWFAGLQSSYAVGAQASKTGYVPDERGWLTGAGLSIRRSALSTLFNAGFEQLNPDRTGKALTSGGDVELCIALRLAGWRLYYDSELVYQHHMPKRRLTASHRRRLHFAFGRGDVVLSHYRTALDLGPAAEPSGVERAPLLRECYWAVRRLARLVLQSRGQNAPSVQHGASLAYQCGYLWELMRSSRHFRSHRQRVFALARRLRA